jgi:DNA-formamidopyrimidine glycosylase
MPEGPEVRVIAKQLNELVKDKTLVSVEGINVPLQRIRYVTSYGKKLLFALDQGWIINHLGMDGRWQIKGQTKYTKAILTFANFRLHYDDLRGFGDILYVDRQLPTSTPDWMQYTLSVHGIDDGLLPYGSVNISLDVCKRTRRRISDLLLDQQYFNGVGNYIKSEALYLSGINPFQPANTLNDNELNRLKEAISIVMLSSYLSNGFTLKSFVDVYDRPGLYVPLVYGRKVDYYGRPVNYSLIGGRPTYWVEAMQRQQL